METWKEENRPYAVQKSCYLSLDLIQHMWNVPPSHYDAAISGIWALANHLFLPACCQKTQKDRFNGVQYSFRQYRTPIILWIFYLIYPRYIRHPQSLPSKWYDNN